MLQYTRRSELIPKLSSLQSNVESDNNPILTYCNWNYEKRHHLTSKKLKSIIKNLMHQNYHIMYEFLMKRLLVQFNIL